MLVKLIDVAIEAKQFAKPIAVVPTAIKALKKDNTMKWFAEELKTTYFNQMLSFIQDIPANHKECKTHQERLVRSFTNIDNRTIYYIKYSQSLKKDGNYSLKLRLSAFYVENPEKYDLELNHEYWSILKNKDLIGKEASIVITPNFEIVEEPKFKTFKFTGRNAKYECGDAFSGEAIRLWYQPRNHEALLQRMGQLLRTHHIEKFKEFISEIPENAVATEQHYINVEKNRTTNLISTDWFRTNKMDNDGKSMSRDDSKRVAESDTFIISFQMKGIYWMNPPTRTNLNASFELERGKELKQKVVSIETDINGNFISEPKFNYVDTNSYCSSKFLQ